MVFTASSEEVMSLLDEVSILLKGIALTSLWGRTMTEELAHFLGTSLEGLGNSPRGTIQCTSFFFVFQVVSLPPDETPSYYQPCSKQSRNGIRVPHGWRQCLRNSRKDALGLYKCCFSSVVLSEVGTSTFQSRHVLDLVLRGVSKVSPMLRVLVVDQTSVPFVHRTLVFSVLTSMETMLYLLHRYCSLPAPYLLRGLATPYLLRRLAAPLLPGSLATPYLIEETGVLLTSLRGLASLLISLRKMVAPYLLSRTSYSLTWLVWKRCSLTLEGDCTPELLRGLRTSYSS
ncbi:hypothetical protein Tco_1114489 [Tanacetum coccineum]|uniref:Uncharacterized protein n=1 Tax=Tanacetum coccineum TaxID=301880 RepID=A0ABQ5IV92_9ASTR